MHLGDGKVEDIDVVIFESGVTSGSGLSSSLRAATVGTVESSWRRLNRR